MVELTLQADGWRSTEPPHYYRFYSYQIVELTATLQLDEDGDVGGTVVTFTNIGTDPSFGLRVYEYWTLTDPTHVPLKQTGPRTGVATLRALVTGAVGLDYSGHEPKATCDYQGEGYSSNPIGFNIYGTRLFWTNYKSVLQPSSADQSPKSSGGNYLYFRFEVTADDSDVSEIEDYTGLPKICVRLTAADPERSSQLLENILLYDSYLAETTLPVPVSPDRIPFVDLQTDEDGMAELYICPKALCRTAGSLSLENATEEPDLGPFLIEDIEHTSPDQPRAPWCTAPVELQYTSSTVDADIPNYTNYRPNDDIFLFCNGRYQALRPQYTNQAPFQTAGLRSASPQYDDTANNILKYIANNSGMPSISAPFPFQAEGPPPQATLDAPSPYYPDVLPAPAVVEAADGWPVNCQTIINGLWVQVPVDDRLLLGDQIQILFALNGYRRASTEPIGARIPLPAIGEPWWPTGLTVTRRAQKEQCIEWWYQPSHFLGFGQMDGRKDPAQAGSVGTLEVQYTVNRDPDGVVYVSEILTLGLDTIPPNGMDGVSDDDDPTIALLNT